MADIEEAFDERGLLGLAFHPDFEENGRFFVRYSAEGEEPEYGAPGAEVPEEVNHLERLSEFHADDDNETADPDSEEILLEVPQPQFNHNAGPIAFGPDGYLYMATGDGGGGGDDDEDTSTTGTARLRAATDRTPNTTCWAESCVSMSTARTTSATTAFRTTTRW